MVTTIIDPRKYIVRVHGKTRSGAEFTGTGFFVNSRGDVATAWHVVEGAAELLVNLPYNDDLPYEVLYQLETEDVALLRIKDVPLGADVPHAELDLNWRNHTKAPDDVTVWGYSASVNSPVPQGFKCNVSGFAPKHGLIQLYCNVNPGDSGGPVINQAGKVIAIARFRDYKRDGQGMAIPINVLTALLSGSGEAAKEAIIELPDLMRAPEVRDTVRLDAEVVERTSRQITVLTTYKRVHDLLHDVRYGCYNRLIIEAQQFADNEFTRAYMSIQASELGKYVENAAEIFEEAVERRNAIGKIHDQLREVSEALQAAYERQDKAQCNRAVQLLRILLQGNTQSNFNVLLNEAARGLDLDGLTAVMQNAAAALMEAAAESARADRFRRGVEDLNALGRELRALTVEHDAWQQVEDMLRTLTRAGPDLRSDLEVIWPQVSPEIARGCEMATRTEGGAAAPDWAAKLRKEADEVEASLQASGAPDAILRLDNVRQKVAERFHTVDKRLLRVCEKIGKVKDPLQVLVEVLR